MARRKRQKTNELVPQLSTAHIDRLNKLMNYPTDSLEDFKKRMEVIAHGNLEVNAETSNYETRVEFKTKKSTTSITVSNALLDNPNAKEKKMLSFILSRAARECFDQKGKVYNDTIRFNVKELVDLGISSSTEKRATSELKDAMLKLSTIRIAGELNTKKKSEMLVLFTGIKIKNGFAEIYVNPRFNWSDITNTYTALPIETFSLKENSFDLAQYITYLARTKTKEVAENGYLKIKLRTIMTQLGIADESTIKANQSRETIKRIERAVNEISEELSNSLDVTLQVEDNASLTEILDSGYVEVKLKGNLKKYIDTRESQRKEKTGESVCQPQRGLLQEDSGVTADYAERNRQKMAMRKLGV